MTGAALVRSAPRCGALKGVDLAACCASGMTIEQIAEEYGASYDRVRIALSRRGLKALSEHDRTYREIALDMRAPEAVEYLLNVIDMLEDIQPERPHPIDELGIHFTKSERRCLVALYDRSPAWLSVQALLNAVYFDRYNEEEGGAATVRVFVWKLRDKLAPVPGWHLENVYGHGYRLRLEEEQGHGG